MLRVVERVLGEGDVHRSGACVARTGYELSLYRQWVDKDGQLEPRHFEVEGHLIAPPDVLEPLLGTSAPLTLHLDAQRAVDVYLLNSDGAVTSADDRGFYPTAGVSS
jgi:hypothetical protein